jgi:hypothetical protein
LQTNKYDAIKYTMAGVSSPTGPNPIVVSDILEKDYYSISEWIEYIGLFMNREKVCPKKVHPHKLGRNEVQWQIFVAVTANVVGHWRHMRLPGRACPVGHAHLVLP